MPIKDCHVIVDDTDDKQRCEELREDDGDQDDGANNLRDCIVEEADCVSQCII